MACNCDCNCKYFLFSRLPWPGDQRWSPRGHILKPLALASRPQVLENWSVLGSRTALFFDLLKFCGDRLKNFCEDLFFFLVSTCACVLGPWPRAFLSLASRVSVLGKAGLGLGLGIFLCPWPWPRALCPRLHLCRRQRRVLCKLHDIRDCFIVFATLYLTKFCLCYTALLFIVEFNME